MKKLKELSKKESIEDLLNETWRDISGFEGVYMVSNMGRVKSLRRVGKRSDHILRNRNNKGYKQVGLCRKGDMENHKVHQLVAEAFLDHIRCGMSFVVHHKNYDKTDNKLDNLEIVTNRYNCSLDKKNKTSKYFFVFITCI